MQFAAVAFSGEMHGQEVDECIDCRERHAERVAGVRTGAGVVEQPRG